ncbi:MAG: ABC transporter permease subunit [Acidimicrobiia bacterium]|nr:ABC transporter permease subunit [Acidimicrobiia bacterium]
MTDIESDQTKAGTEPGITEVSDGTDHPSLTREELERRHQHTIEKAELSDLEIGEIGEQSSLWADAWRILRKKPIFVVSALLIIVFVAMAIFPQTFSSIPTLFVEQTCPQGQEGCWQNPQYAELGRSAEAPSAEHWFGLDVQGRDQVTRVIYGARNSLLIGLTVSLGATIIAIALGSMAGYFGRWADALLSRLTDIWFVIPTLLAGIAFLNIVPTRGPLVVSAVLIAFGWASMMRIVRSSVISERNQEYVQAARALGAGPTRIMFKHILPNSLAPVLVFATITLGVIIQVEATLSFLGVGLQLPAISWGLMVSEAQRRVQSSPHLLVYPGLFISMTVFAFILMGDALRDALDPRLR